MLISVVIRTLNEEKHLDELLAAIANQHSDVFTFETVIVDSGSTDNTLAIAADYGARITHIKQEDFSFGRSLNVGCGFAQGEILVFVSGHCIPANENWLDELCMPIYNGVVQYTYGRQLGRDTTKFSERQVFDKYFPAYSMIPQEGFFCNNANAALLKQSWRKVSFDEELTGLEDMFLARGLVETGELVGYVAEAPVYHIHDETWPQVKRRYEREAIALQKITPEIHMTFGDFVRCSLSSVFSDLGVAIKERVFCQEIKSILSFRLLQYWGGYKGNHIHRKLSLEAKRRYFYPNQAVTQSRPSASISMDKTNEKNNGFNASEG